MGEEGRDLSGWFVPALITPLGLDKLTDCHTHTHILAHRTHTQQDISPVKQWCILSAFSACVCERYSECVWARTGVHESV